MLLSSTGHCKCCRPGSVLPLVALSLIPLLSLAALVVDGGFLLSDKSKVQAAADAAALAAAIDLYSHYDTNAGTDPGGTASTSAQKTAKDNGFNNGSGGVV